MWSMNALPQSGGAGEGLKELPSDPPAAAAPEWDRPLHSQQPIAAPGSARLAALKTRPWRWVNRPAARSFKPARRIHPAGRSHLGLAGRWLRWGRVGGRAEHDCIELAVELGEPRVLFLDLLGLAPHSQGFALQLLRSQLGGVDLASRCRDCVAS